MHLKNVALCLMQPGENKNFRSGVDSVECVDEANVDHEPRFRRIMVWLARRILPATQR